jgi:hypothetical protein
VEAANTNELVERQEWRWTRSCEGKRKDGALYIEEELGWGPRASYTLGMSDDGSGGVALPGVI